MRLTAAGGLANRRRTRRDAPRDVRYCSPEDRWERGEASVQISVSSQRTGDVLTVRVVGDVDLATAPTVANAILDAIAVDGVREVHVDLSGVEFLDSSGVALL